MYNLAIEDRHRSIANTKFTTKKLKFVLWEFLYEVLALYACIPIADAAIDIIAAINEENALIFPINIF